MAHPCNSSAWEDQEFKVILWCIEFKANLKCCQKENNTSLRILGAKTVESLEDTGITRGSASTLM